MTLHAIFYFILSIVTVFLFLTQPQEIEVGITLISWSFFALPCFFRLVGQVAPASKEFSLVYPVSHVAGLLSGITSHRRRHELYSNRAGSRFLLMLLVALAALIVVKTLSPGPGFSLDQAGFFVLLGISFWGAQTLPHFSRKVRSFVLLTSAVGFVIMGSVYLQQIENIESAFIFFLWIIFAVEVSQFSFRSRSSSHRYLVQI